MSKSEGESQEVYKSHCEGCDTRDEHSMTDVCEDCFKKIINHDELQEKFDKLNEEFEKLVRAYNQFVKFINEEHHENIKLIELDD